MDPFSNGSALKARFTRILHIGASWKRLLKYLEVSGSYATTGRVLSSEDCWRDP